MRKIPQSSFCVGIQQSTEFGINAKITKKFTFENPSHMKRSENHKNSGKDSIFHTIELGNWLRMNRSHNAIKFERSSDGNFYCQHVPFQYQLL